ncbi:MAG: hypothetical protein KAU06_03295 [Candidatus Marinimicrobia bacterium]|nr:hypothetical protein [Candidatus Neomarinimicrobiota bacterium]
MTIEERNNRIEALVEKVAEIMLAALRENLDSGIEFYRSKEKDGVESIVFRVRDKCDFKDVECPHDETLVSDLISEYFTIDEDWAKELEEMRAKGKQVFTKSENINAD